MNKTHGDPDSLGQSLRHLLILEATAGLSFSLLSVRIPDLDPLPSWAVTDATRSRLDMKKLTYQQ